MLNLKIKEPDYKALYESRQAKIDSLNKTIIGLKARNTKLENEVITIKNGSNFIINQLNKAVTSLENELSQSKKISDCSCWDIIDIDFGLKKCMGCGKTFNTY